MANYIFPMRVFVKNVRREGTMYIGYDQEFPGMNHKKSKYSMQEGDSAKNYDSKTFIDRDMLITLKNKGNKTVHMVYFSIVAGADLLIFDFKVEFLGFERRDRTNSESFRLKVKESETELSMPLLRMNTEPSSPLKGFVRSGGLKESRQRIAINFKKEDLHLMAKEDMQHHSSKSNLIPLLSPEKQKRTTSNFNKTKDSSLAMLKTRGKSNGFKDEKSEVAIRLDEAKRNKEMLELYKEKDKELREMASGCKAMISQFQVISPSLRKPIRERASSVVK